MSTRIGAAAAAAAVGLLLISAAPAAAASALSAQLVTVGGAPIAAGGSGSTFTVGFPPGARCPGDSTKPPFNRIYSYLVPQGTDPASISFKGGTPDRGFGLYSFDTIFSNNVVRDTDLVAPVVASNLTFAPLPVRGLIPAGAQRATWETGIACATYTGAVTTFWNVEVVFARNSADSLGYTWTVVPHVKSGQGNTSFELAGVAVVVALGAAAIWLVVHKPRSTRAALSGGGQ